MIYHRKKYRVDRVSSAVTRLCCYCGNANDDCSGANGTADHSAPMSVPMQLVEEVVGGCPLSLSLSLIIFRSSFFFVFRNALVRRGVERNTVRYDALAPRHWSTGSARARPIGAARGRCKLLPPVESHPIRCPRRPTGFLLPVFPHLRTIVPTCPTIFKIP